ncbi:MAG: hypothetical protein ACKPDI_05420 [Actinomycetota bacterium]
MRTLRALTVIPVVALLLVSCGDSDDSAATTAAPASSAEATTTSFTVTTMASGTTMADNNTTVVAEGPIQIDVVVGVDSGADRVERVGVGSDITVNITNPNAADEFHVHGIDLEQNVDAGVTATFNFVADTPGTYEIESHETEEVLVVIEVV